MRLGQAAMEALRAEITGCLKPGDELVVACCQCHPEMCS